MSTITKPIYVVVQYRYGRMNHGPDVVLVTTDEDQARQYAESEQEFRGGKYALEVQRWNDGDTVSDPETVAYFPSAYGEKCAHVNPRMIAHENIGSTVTQEIEMGNDGRSLPRWLVEKVEHELKISDALYGEQAREARG